MNQDRSSYRARPFLTTKAEHAFYRVLEEIIEPATPENHPWPFRRISQKHLDFVLFDRKSTRIRLAIELDDASHRRRARVCRDQWLDGILAEVGVPLLRQRAQARYDKDDLHRDVHEILKRSSRLEKRPGSDATGAAQRVSLGPLHDRDSHQGDGR